MASLSPDVEQHSASLSAIGDSIVPIDQFLMTMSNFQTTRSMPLFGTHVNFDLKAINKPLYVAIMRAKTDVCNWYIIGGLPDGKTGYRGQIHQDLLGGYSKTAGAFSAASQKLTEIIDAIDGGTASPKQLSDAQSAFGDLEGIISDAAQKITHLQAGFSDYQSTMTSDINALQFGKASLEDAIADIPNQMLDWLTNEFSGSGFAAGAIFEMAQQYAGAYAKALTTMKDHLADMTTSGDTAGAAMRQLATNFATFAQVTADAGQHISSAKAEGLKSILAELDIASAANDWATLTDLANSIAGKMSKEGLFGEHPLIVL